MSVDNAPPPVPRAGADGAASALELVGGALRPWLGLFLVCAGFSINPKFLHVFWTADYLPNILQQAATNIILAVGMTFVIMTGGIDLSVGSVLALCGVTLGLTVQTGPPPFLCYTMVVPAVFAVALALRRLGGPRARIALPLALAAAPLTLVIGGLAAQRFTAGGIQLEGALLASLAVGTACGLVNGLVITYGRVPPFVMTLGMLTAARGLTVYATDGNSISDLPVRLGILGNGLPLVLIALAVVVIGAVTMARTRQGRYIQSVGGNEEASRLSGVNVAGTKILAYALAGLTSAIAAIVLTAKFRVAETGAGTNAELNAIAAVVIGGTSLSGGKGSVVGSLVGALTMAVLNAGLVIVGVKDTLQGVVIGAVIVATVALDQLRQGGGGRFFARAGAPSR